MFRTIRIILACSALTAVLFGFTDSLFFDTQAQQLVEWTGAGVGVAIGVVLKVANFV